MYEALLPDTVYHIFNHANGNENIFVKTENYYYFLKKYAEYIYPIAETYAYCLMGNHFHLMVEIRSEEELKKYFLTKKPDLTGFENLSGLLSQQFSNFFNAYTKAFNLQQNRRGSLFQRPFKRKPVLDESYFTELIVYIHNNPVKHGFVNNILDWEHSSFHSYLSQKQSKLNRRYLENWFGDSEKLIAFHKEMSIKIDIMDL